MGGYRMTGPAVYCLVGSVYHLPTLYEFFYNISDYIIVCLIFLFLENPLF